MKKENNAENTSFVQHTQNIHGLPFFLQPNEKWHSDALQVQ